MTPSDIHEIIQDVTIIALAISVILSIKIGTLAHRRLDILQQMIMDYIRNNTRS